MCCVVLGVYFYIQMKIFWFDRGQFEELCVQLLMKVDAPLRSVIEQTSK